jgi:hypothetical protein
MSVNSMVTVPTGASANTCAFLQQRLRGVWLAAGDTGGIRTFPSARQPYASGMNSVARRHRLAGFIDIALAPRTWHGRRLASVPIPGTVLATCGDALRDVAAVLRDEDRTVDASTLHELERMLTRGAGSPLYDGSHPIRALHALVSIESRFGQAPARAA